MQLGVCAGTEYAPAAMQAGLDYFEWSVGAFLQPRQEADAFTAIFQKVKAAPLPCPAVNVFIPGDLKITGPTVDMTALTRYAETALERARLAGIQVIVFGSGGARRVPDGFDRQTAEEQLIKFGRMLGKHASQAGVTIAVEPLNRQECNILNSVTESAVYVRRVDHPSVRLLVDAYHWAKEVEKPEAIMQNGDILVHAHIATKNNRQPPGAEEFDFVPFFQALRQAGYHGRLSIEAALPAVDEQSKLVSTLQNAVYLMRSLATG